MFIRTALGLILLFTAAGVSAQKPVERSPLEIGEDLVESVEADVLGRFVGPDGTPRQMAGLDHAVTPGTPEAMAREYLGTQAAALRLAAPDLRHRATRTGRAGHTVRFTQMVGEVPVYGSETVVNIDPQNRVQLVVNGARQDVQIATTPTLDATTARQIAFAHLGVGGTLHADETELMVYPMADGARLAWRVSVVPETPRGDWEAFVDAQTGDLLRVADRTLYHHAEDGGEDDDPPADLIPTEAAQARLMRVDGTAFIFDPDPLTSTGSTYGGGYVDGNDANTPELEAARVSVALRDITFDGSVYQLKGPYAEQFDWGSPLEGNYDQATPAWNFTRDARAFEAATAYYHIDTMMRYINETLGVALQPFQYPTGVRYDSHGWDNNDNSSYTPSTGRLRFGDGCVDDSEDADVILHELGHGIHDWLTNGSSSNSNVDGLGEGLGDFFAASYTRSLGLLDPSDPAYHWVFKWDGHNPCWPGRVTNTTMVFPGSGSFYDKAQMWSAALMEIWNDLGRERLETAVLEGIAMTSTTTNQAQAAQAVIQAAANMGYSEDELRAMFDRFTARGYSVTLPTPTAAEPTGPADQPGGFDLTGAYPNPFGPAANFTLRVAEAQHVSIALFDALGRQVQTIYDGPMAAGERRVFAIDARDLPSGVYVYRALGEGVSASQSVVLAK